MKVLGAKMTHSRRGHTRRDISIAAMLSAAAVLAACSSADSNGEATSDSAGSPTTATLSPPPATDAAPTTPDEAEPTIATVAMLDRMWEESADHEEMCQFSEAGDFRAILRDHATDWDINEVNAYFAEKCASAAPSIDATALLDVLWDDTEDREGMCALHRSGDFDDTLREMDMDWDLEEVDAYFLEKCADVADGSREKPFPIDQALKAGDWSVRVTGVNLDAADVVAAENQFNDPPAQRHQYVMVDVEMTYNGSTEPVDPAWLFEFAVVGSAGNTFDDSCGVIPSPVRDVADMYRGATAAANVCIPVASEQLDGATLRIGPRRGIPVFLALP